jgi:hypothetical protein
MVFESWAGMATTPAPRARTPMETVPHFWSHFFNGGIGREISKSIVMSEDRIEREGQRQSAEEMKADVFHTQSLNSPITL